MQQNPILILLSYALSVGLLAALLLGDSTMVNGAGYVAVVVGGLCLLTLIPEAGRRAVSNTPQGALDALLGIAVVLALVFKGQNVAYFVYGLAVGLEMWARRFKFVLL